MESLGAAGESQRVNTTNCMPRGRREGDDEKRLQGIQPPAQHVHPVPKTPRRALRLARQRSAILNVTK